MQHCILVKWTPDAGDKDALAKEAEAIFAQAVADGVATALTIRRNVINRPNRYDLLIELTMTPDMPPAYERKRTASPLERDVRRAHPAEGDFRLRVISADSGCFRMFFPCISTHTAKIDLPILSRSGIMKMIPLLFWWAEKGGKNT